MSRRRIFSLLAALTALVALSALLSACGGGGGSEDPQKVIEQATFEGLESGQIELSETIDKQGKEGGKVEVEAAGSFQSTGKKSLPELAMTIDVHSQGTPEKVDFQGGLTVLGDRAYVGYKGKQYEIEPTIFGLIKSGFESAQQEGANESKGGEATACRHAVTGIDLSEFVNNLEDEGDEEVAGVKTTKLSGDLDPTRAVDALIKLVETPACAAELEASGGAAPLQQLKAQKSTLTGAIKKAHAEVYVGEDDHIVRKVVGEATIEPKGSGEKAEVEFEFTLGKVNEKQAIKAPAKAEPLTDLFAELGINPNELLGLMQGGGGAGLGSLLEGLTSEFGGGGASGGSSLESLGEGAIARKFEECLHEAQGAADVQKCTTLME